MSVIRTEIIVPDGLIKEVLQEGTGDAVPQTGDEVVAHYTGRLLDGSVFDSSVERGQPFKFTLGRGQVIQGWDQGFATMKKGEKAVLECRPEYGYGASGSPPKIPPQATLRFEVELLSFAPKKKETWEMNAAEKVQTAEQAKEKGNVAYTSGDLVTALQEYRYGLDALQNVTEDAAYDPVPENKKAGLRPLKVTLHSNSAMVYLKHRAWSEAVKSCTEALKLDGKHAKSLFRRGTARAHLAQLDEAKADLQEAAKLAPTDAGIKAELARVQGLIKAGIEREKKAFGGMFNRKEPGSKAGNGSANANETEEGQAQGQANAETVNVTEPVTA